MMKDKAKEVILAKQRNELFITLEPSMILLFYFLNYTVQHFQIHVKKQ
jgi:hypothetical protein